MIRDLAARSSLLWCVIGYFNDLMAGNERQGGRYHSRNLLQGFSSTIFDCGLQDLGFQDENFTWERFRGTEKWVQERLDRGLASQAWRDMFKKLWLK